MRLFALSLLLSACASAAAADNALTPEEKTAGWKLLFDGKSFNGWVDPSKKTPPGDCWTIEDGCLKARAKSRITEDLFSTGKYQDFELEWDWKIVPGGNSGVKYRIQDTVFLDHSKDKPGVKFEQSVGDRMERSPSKRANLPPDAEAQDYVIGFEYQMIDDSTNKDALRGGKYQTGALYDMVAPSHAAAKPVGEYNHSRVVVRGDHVEHWLNGSKVVDTDLSTEDTKESISKRWAPAPKLMNLLIKHPRKLCPISLQNHGNDTWFRNIKIRPLRNQ